jgi:hypothetical protein
MKAKYTIIRPRLAASRLDRFTEFCGRVSSTVRKGNQKQFGKLSLIFRNEMMRELNRNPGDGALSLALVKSVMLDLIGIGWQMKVEHGEVKIASPTSKSDDLKELKESIRQGHLLARDGQLRQESVRDFVQGMERRRLTDKGWHSIFSVMRDGIELAAALKIIESLASDEEKLAKLREVVSPYVQLVTEDGVCRQTGLPLRDIWRYFRHTWVNSYKSLPGRSMSILIRDAAARNHPVIGIAALGSSVAQQRMRDKWIGWDQNTMVEKIRKTPTSKYGKWLLRCLDEQIQSLYLADFFFDGTCKRDELKTPNDDLITRLEKRGNKEIKAHRMYPQTALHKAAKPDGSTDAYWEEQAQTHLFRSKRCRTLAKLIRIAKTFQECGLKKGSSAELRSAIEKASMRNAVEQLVRFVKAQHVGIDMMDIVVCGAIAPYNAILGGKLICMLLCGPEIVKMYRARYGMKASVIASSMKGAAVVRVPQLVFLGTTSLYGVGSSQYNRIRIPCEVVGGKAGEQLAYECLGKSEGYGSYQFSDLTVRLVDILIGRWKEGRRVNSIFGEGVNPRMRKLRDAFEAMGLPSDEILRHRNPRIVYAVSLARNASDVLLGLAKRPQYLIPQVNSREKMELISEYWRRRWLLGRIRRNGVLEEVCKHTLAYPVSHGARVELPALELELQEAGSGDEEDQ